MKKIKSIILLTFLFSCGNNTEKGITDAHKLETIRLFNEKFEMSIPSGMLRLSSEQLATYDNNKPPQIGYFNSDKSVIITMRNLPVKTEDEEVRFNTIVEVLDRIANDAGAKIIRNDITEEYASKMFIMDIEGKISDKIINSSTPTLGSFIFLVVEQGEYFFFEMHYPTINIGNTLKLKDSILKSFRILKPRVS